MYETLNTAGLAQVLNQFSAPMFALERISPDAPFLFIAVNDAMEVSGEFVREDVLGKKFGTVLGTRDAAMIEHKYTRCLAQRTILRFSDRLAFLPDHGVWDTTLQPACLTNGHERVIATCVQEAVVQKRFPNTVSLDNIEYLSAIADFQLQNLISMFEHLPAQTLLATQAEHRIEKLSGMCRSVQRAVADINRTAQKAQLGPCAQDIPPQARLAPQRQEMFQRCGTLRAIKEVSSEVYK